MNLFRLVCGKPALLFFPVAVILLLLASSRVMTEPWPIKHFEVVNVEPGGQVSTGGGLGELMGVMARGIRETGITDPDFPGIFKTVTLSPESKAKEDIELVLHQAAIRMEQWGFSPPALEPVVTTPDGVKRYRVYLVTGLDHISGAYHLNPCNTLFRDERVIVLDADNVLANGSLNLKGVQTTVHELFHAVQYGSPFFNNCNGNSIGNWITEGQARAVGWSITSEIRESAYEAALGVGHDSQSFIWGQREYSNRLPVPEYMSQEAYRTSSLWRFLSEVDASGLDVAASPGVHPFDFSYLSRLLQTGPSKRDCNASGAPCVAEVQWLDAGLRSLFGKPLRELYARFMQAYALYGDGRLIGSTFPDDHWLDGSFTYMDGARRYKGCKTVKLAPTPDSLQQTMVIPNFKALSTQCWEVALQGFEEQNLSVAITTTLPADPPQPRLEQLTAVLANGSLTMDKASVERTPPGERRRASWIYWFENNKETLFLLTNVANDAEATRALPKLEVTFTVLREYASMSASESASGPSPADIDTPLPIEFDSLHGYAYPYSYRRIDDQYVGIDNMRGLTKPCFIKLGLLRNTENGDQMAFQMNHEGPITPGHYVFLANNKKHPDEVHGGYVGGFSIGAGNSLSEGHQQDFYIDSGNVTIESVSGGLVRGHMEANGVRRNPYSGQNKFEKWGHLNLTIGMKFSILMKSPAGKPYSNTPYACLQEPSPVGGPGNSRRTTDTPTTAQGVTPAARPNTPASKGSPERDGPAGNLQRDKMTADPGSPVTPATPTEPGQSPGAAVRPGEPDEGAPGTAEIEAIKQGPRWAIIRATGDVQDTVIMATPRLTGGCSGSTPVSIGLFEGQANDEDFASISINSEGIVGTGETGSFPLKELNWDYGTVPIEDMPAHLNLRVSNRFTATATMELTAHDPNLETRRMQGTIHAPGTTNHEGQAADVEMEFRVDWSCGLR